MKLCWTIGMALLMSAWAGAVEAPAPPLEPEATLAVDFGGDLRLRYLLENNLPNDRHGEKGHTDYARVRTRLWGKVTAERLEGFVRVANEFRYYNSREGDQGKQRFPDQLFIDSLYVKASGLFDLFDLKVGRQEMAFGSGRIVNDGTGGDGSRSCYFDAARLTFDFGPKRTLDAFALYMAREDWLPTLGHTHDAKSKGTKSYDYDASGYNHNESGAGLYYQDRSNKALGWDAYYVWKVEEGSRSTVIAQGTRFESHTAGVRLLPKFSETFSGEVELAGQLGDQSLAAMLAYGGLTYAPQIALKPQFTAALYYLSGDKAGGRGNSAWHPVFNRETGIGEAVAPMFNKYAYNNLLYPHLRISLVPAEHHKATLEVGPMFAPTREEDGMGGHYGTFRGAYAQVKYTVALGKLLEAEFLEGMTCSFLGEYLSKGDAFKDGQRGTALLARFEVSYAF